MIKVLIPVREFTHPAYYAGSGALYVLFGWIIAQYLFPSHATLMSLLLPVLFCTPFIYEMVVAEEKIETRHHNNAKFVSHYGEFLQAIVALFLGQTAMYTILYLLASDLHQLLFSITALGVTVHEIARANINYSDFVANLLISVRYMLWAAVLSLFYGSGAVLMITISAVKLAIFLVEIPQYSIIGAMGAFTFTIFQVVGYIAIGTAIALLVQAVKKHHFGTKKFATINKDVSLSFLIGCLFVLCGILLETIVFANI